MKNTPKLIGLLGKAGSGKDTVGKMITDMVKGGRTISLADPLKKFCQEVFDFTDAQLWGPSENRNAPDTRYARRVEGVGDHQVFTHLTPRFALQTLGTEWGRSCYNDVWIDYGIRHANRLLTNWSTFEQSMGLLAGPMASCVVITDCRFLNEAKAIREAGGEVWRITRPDANAAAVTAAGVAGHASEMEQSDPEMEKYVTWGINNNSTLEDLKTIVEVLLTKAR